MPLTARDAISQPHNTFKIYFNLRSNTRKQHAVYAHLADGERVKLEADLAATAEYVDVARFRCDKVDAELVNEPIHNYQQARNALADMLGISTLVEGR